VEEDFDILRRGLIKADRDAAVGAATRLVQAEVDPRVILESGMAQAMFTLGQMWQRGEVFLPEVVASAEIFKQCNAVVEPALLAVKQDADVQNIVIMATVKGDLHDLGKNIPADKIIAAVRELDPRIVGLSALLTTTVPYQETVIKALVREGLRDDVKVMVGGAPVTPEWADKIGADGYANNAPEAVEIAKKLAGLAQS
jgi:methanogenic corrinoid protein MtbC1